MEKIEIKLEELVDPPKTDSISGRRFGQEYAQSKDVINHIGKDKKIILIINDEKVKAINDSFIKGFFSGIFEKYKSKTTVNSFIEIRSNDYFKRLIDKNFILLDAIYNK